MIDLDVTAHKSKNCIRAAFILIPTACIPFPAVKNAERDVEGPRGPKCTRNSYIYYFESGMAVTRITTLPILEDSAIRRFCSSLLRVLRR